MCISPVEETLAISTDKGQLYSFSLSSMEDNKVESPPQLLLPLSDYTKPFHFTASF